MTLYPVIMCGGAGTRLWPASRPSRPKQFVPLAGNRTLFQDTVLRVAPLATGRLVIVAGVKHRKAILEQLSEIDVEAQLILEPEARDSAPAMAAAAAWVAVNDPEGVVAFLASDHHVPDDVAFREALMKASEAAAKGRIVTLGVKPTEPSSAYGYIRPSAPGLSEVVEFVEKPNRAVAVGYISAGYLWNSGNFICRANVLLSELTQYAPSVAEAARKSIPKERHPVEVLTSDFTEAPKISIDYALMEETRLASVLAVDFAWSDLGAWDSIEATGEGSVGAHVFEDAEGCLVRAPDGVMVAALGVRNLAIVVESDAVLVADLSRSQEVKRVVERIKAVSPSHLDFATPHSPSLSEAAHSFARWMRVHALPIWSSQGQREDGAFAEMLTLEGRPVDAQRRARVQARQIYVFAQAGALGWAGPWRRAVREGLQHLLKANRRPEDGLLRTLLASDDTPLDETAMLYDQAFFLLALASAKSAIAAEDAEPMAREVLAALTHFEVGGPGLKEAGEHPYQSNAHMHLLEACLAWEQVSEDPIWVQWSDRVVDLAVDHMIDKQGGFIREFFDENWKPAAADAGRLVEPGHQFEWAWLMARYAKARQRPEILEVAKRLYQNGAKGISNRSPVAVDALDQDGTFRTERARLWPQTEWLKAALILAGSSKDGERTRLLADANRAMAALNLYLKPTGLWRDKRLANGKFIDEAAPSSSFYHIMAAFAELQAQVDQLGTDDQALNLA